MVAVLAVSVCPISGIIAATQEELATSATTAVIAALVAGMANSVEQWR